MSVATKQPRTNTNPPAAPLDEGSSSERVTVNLSRRSVTALNHLATPTSGMTKTDAINKALQFYDDVLDVIARGGAVYLREPGETEVERVRIF